MTDRFFMGVDPGQTTDPTAIAIVSVAIEDRKQIFRCGHLERLPLNTSYVGVAGHVHRLVDQLPNHATIVLDETGVGKAVRDIFHNQGLFPTCVTITAGTDEVKVEGETNYFHVPKLQLVSRVQALLHTGQLLIQKDLADTPALVSELQDFRAHVTDSGRWTFGARSGAHDDLVLALALACWRGYSKGTWVGLSEAAAMSENPAASATLARQQRAQMEGVEKGLSASICGDTARQLGPPSGILPPRQHPIGRGSRRVCRCWSGAPPSAP
jgi:hypothetical protein